MRSSYLIIIHTCSTPERSIVVFARFLLVVLALLLFALAVAGFGLEFVFPELVHGRGVDVGEDDFEHVRVPCYGLAFDAFLYVL
jgi:hypothetical protein